MKNEWLLEAYWQLRLGSLWSCCKLLLDRVSKDGEDRASHFGARVDTEVLSPFLAREWVPGVRNIITVSLPKRWQTKDIDCVHDGRAFPEAMYRRLVESRWSEVNQSGDIEAIHNQCYTAANALAVPLPPPGDNLRPPQDKSIVLLS